MTGTLRTGIGGTLIQEYAYEKHGYKLLEIVKVDDLKTMYISIADIN